MTERAFRVTEINGAGEIIGYEKYFNSLSPRENMVTSCMGHHKNNNIWDKRQRKKYNKQIKGRDDCRLMFFIGDTTFISQNLRNYEVN